MLYFMCMCKKEGVTLNRKRWIGLGAAGIGVLLLYTLFRWQPEGVSGCLLLAGVLLLIFGAGIWILAPRQTMPKPPSSPREASDRPWISWGIALVCLGVFAVVQLYPKLPAAVLGLWDKGIRAGEYWRLLTYGFTHRRWAHLAGNELSLLILGGRMERQYGRLWFCMVYLLGLLGGGFSFLAFDGTGVCIGASGALYGVMGFLIPVYIADRAEMGNFLQNCLIPLVLVGAAESLLSPGVSGWCHAGGFLPGLLFGLGFLLHRQRTSE